MKEYNQTKDSCKSRELEDYWNGELNRKIREFEGSPVGKKKKVWLV